MQPRRRISRRNLLAMAVLAVAGCHGHSASTDGPTPTPRHPVVPDAAALAEARRAEARLLAAYDTHLRRAGRLQRQQLEVARAIHAAHLSALGGDAASKASAGVAGALAPALQRSARRLRQLALAATSGGNAALLASVAASHEAGAG